MTVKRQELSIDAQYSKSGDEQKEHSGSFLSERRKYSRRQRQHGRRNSLALRGQVKCDRRRNEQCDLTISHDQSAHLQAELVNARFNSARAYGEFHDSLCLWVVTEQSDLSSQLQSTSDRFTSVNVIQLKFKEIEYLDNKLGKTCPNVILIDMRLSINSVIERLHKIREYMATGKIILLYDKILPDFIINEIFKNRVTGLLQAGADYKLFEKAIHAVHRGEFWFPHHVMRQIFDVLSLRQNLPDSFLSRNIVLTKCEYKVVKLAVNGLSNKLIAQYLAISPETVKKHLKAIFIKTGVKSRIQLTSDFLLRIKDVKS